MEWTQGDFSTVMTIHLSTFFLFFLSLCRAGASDAGQVVVTENDNAGEIRMIRGDTLIVQLKTRICTGYGWQILKGDSLSLKPAGETVIETHEERLTGGQETQILRFIAQRPGVISVRLGYCRPWEMHLPPEKYFHIRVHIR
jgi:predicted secreted protein